MPLRLNWALGGLIAEICVESAIKKDLKALALQLHIEYICIQKGKQLTKEYKMEYAINYLNEKKVPFFVKVANGKESIFGVKFEKKGKFIRANGKIVSSNMYKWILKYV